MFAKAYQDGAAINLDSFPWLLVTAPDGKSWCLPVNDGDDGDGTFEMFLFSVGNRLLPEYHYERLKPVYDQWHCEADDDASLVAWFQQHAPRGWSFVLSL